MGKKFRFIFEIIKLSVIVCLFAAAYFLLRGYLQPGILTEQHEYLVQKQPAPFISYSANRDAMAKRDNIFQNENQVSRLFLIQDGKFIAQFEIQGGVTSLNTKYVENANTIYPQYVPNNDGTVDQGSNDGIFFFTTDGTYYEWKGDYLLDASNSLKINTSELPVSQSEAQN